MTDEELQLLLKFTEIVSGGKTKDKAYSFIFS